MEVAQVFARWQADGAPISSLVLEVDATPQDQIAGLSDMEVFEAIFAGHFPLASIRASRDFIPNHMTPSVAILQGRSQHRHYNSRGTVHGGCFATLLDSRLSYEVHSPLPARPGYTTLKHGAPLSDRMPMVRAKGKVIRVGHKLATAKGRIFGSEGEPYAHVTAACLIFHHLVPISESMNQLDAALDLLGRAPIGACNHLQRYTAAQNDGIATLGDTS